MKIVINVENKDFTDKFLLLGEDTKNVNENIKLINQKKNDLALSNKSFIDINGGEGLWSFFLGKYFDNVLIYEDDKEKVKLLKKNKVLMEQEAGFKIFNYKISNKNSKTPKSYTLDWFNLKNIGLIKIASYFETEEGTEEINKIVEGMLKTLSANKFPDLIIEVHNKSFVFESLLKLNYKPVEDLSNSLVLYRK